MTRKKQSSKQKVTRLRGVVSLTLAPRELQALDRLAKCRGLTRSRIVGQLALQVKA